MKERVRNRKQSKALVETPDPYGDAMVQELHDALLQGPDPETFPVPTLLPDGSVSKPTSLPAL